MVHPHMFCPVCQRVNRMVVSVSLMRGDDPTEQEDSVLMLNYQCEVCQSFIGQAPYQAAVRDEQVLFLEFQPSYHGG